ESIVVPPASRTRGASSSPNDSMPKAISLALTVVIGSPGDVVGQVRRGRRRDHTPGWAGPGDEAVGRHRDVSDDSSHAWADPVRRPNSSLTQEACGGCELDSTTHLMRGASRRFAYPRDVDDLGGVARTYRGLIIDWGGVLTTSIPAAVRAWLDSDDI